ncbi:hypothetical protein B484DRAFT_410696 [Ochromonadaceae sp. CCMP2298]|nr:hypothetical protein B484DRAFT_410696 [Ochromonadaceae sp. CCMP2298]
MRMLRMLLKLQMPLMLRMVLVGGIIAIGQAAAAVVDNTPGEDGCLTKRFPPQ